MVGEDLFEESSVACRYLAAAIDSDKVGVIGEGVHDDPSLSPLARPVPRQVLDSHGIPWGERGEFPCVLRQELFCPGVPLGMCSLAEVCLQPPLSPRLVFVWAIGKGALQLTTKDDHGWAQSRVLVWGVPVLEESTSKLVGDQFSQVPKVAHD